MQSPVEIVDPGPVEEIAPGVTQGEGSGRGEARRIEPVVRPTAAVVSDHAIAGIELVDGGHRVWAVPAGIELEAGRASRRAYPTVANGYRKTRLQSGDTADLPTVRQAAWQLFEGSETADAGNSIVVADHETMPRVKFRVAVVGPGVEGIVAPHA